MGGHPLSDLFTVAEAAAILQMSEPEIRALIVTHQLRTERFEPTMGMRVPADSLREYMATYQ